MAPFVETFPASALPFRSEITEKNKRRKDFSGENLKGCDLLEMLQYDCGIEGPVTRGSVVICRPVVRLFRRCADRTGTFLVETTAWEGYGKVG